MTYSVIIPTLNAEKHLVATIQSVRRFLSQAEVIVVDGQSTDGTRALAESLADHVYSSDRGRGIQMNEGARHAKGHILLFLHADTQLPFNAQCILDQSFEQGHVQIGTFGMRFDQSHWLLDFYAKFTHMDSLWTSFGDQCIVVRRSFYDVLEGFPDWKLFEDVRFLQEARRRTKIFSFPAEVTTSAIRFQKKGILTQQLRNGWFILQYLMGVSPDELSQKYSS